MQVDDWQDRPVVASTRAIMRLDRTLVRASLHAGSSPYGEPLWASRWTLDIRRRSHREGSAGALWWLLAGAAINEEPTGYLTPREWADEMARIRKL
jgi:hypothetical protein